MYFDIKKYKKKKTEIFSGKKTETVNLKLFHVRRFACYSCKLFSLILYGNDFFPISTQKGYYLNFPTLSEG